MFADFFVASICFYRCCFSSHNDLASPDVDVLKALLERNVSVNLESNPFSCTCDLLAFLNLYKAFHHLSNFTEATRLTGKGSILGRGFLAVLAVPAYLVEIADSATRTPHPEVRSAAAARMVGTSLRLRAVCCRVCNIRENTVVSLVYYLLLGILDTLRPWLNLSDDRLQIPSTGLRNLSSNHCHI